jgi:hypothetical protein
METKLMFNYLKPLRLGSCLFVMSNPTPQRWRNLAHKAEPIAAVIGFLLDYLSVGRGGKRDNTARLTIGAGECGQPEIAPDSMQLRMHAWMPS